MQEKYFRVLIATNTCFVDLNVINYILNVNLVNQLPPFFNIFECNFYRELTIERVQLYRSLQERRS